LDRLAPTLEKILEQLTKHCTVVQNSHGTEEVLEKILEQLSKNCTAVQNSHGTEVEKLDIEVCYARLVSYLHYGLFFNEMLIEVIYLIVL
jgi:hypothetical protein